MSKAPTENGSVLSEHKRGSNPHRLNNDSKSMADSMKDPIVHWSDENEKILVEWCDVAQCYKWLNARSHARLSYMHAWFTIPAIVLSTISGTASFAQTSLPIAYQVYSPMAIGGINIFIGILTTVGQYLKIAELNEAHRVSSIAWDKFARNIRIELAKIPDERMDAGPFIKMCRQEFDRLMETSPMIPEKITNEFNTKFKKHAKQFRKLKKPDICDTITSVSEVRNKWYLQGKEEENSDEDSENDSVDLEQNKSNLLELQQKMLKEKDEELRKHQREEADKAKKMLDELTLIHKKEEEHRLKHDGQIEAIKIHIDTFENTCGRKPMNYEIIEAMKDQIDSDVLERFLDTYNIGESV